jgi:hypothetical protein
MRSRPCPCERQADGQTVRLLLRSPMGSQKMAASGVRAGT